jgi:hypothetical protein
MSFDHKSGISSAAPTEHTLPTTSAQTIRNMNEQCMISPKNL